MKKMYQITKGQIITIWIFSIIGFFIALSESSYSDFATFLAILIPAFLIFYTIGWRNEHNIESGFKLDISKFKPTKKKLKILGIIILTIGIIIGIIFTITHLVKSHKLKKDYDNAILIVDSLREDVKLCIKPALEKQYQIEERNCNLLRNKIKHDYNFCVSLYMINSPASCLYENDYESIDCSKEALSRKAEANVSYTDTYPLCKKSLDLLFEANRIIKEYNN